MLRTPMSGIRHVILCLQWTLQLGRVYIVLTVCMLNNAVLRTRSIIPWHGQNTLKAMEPRSEQLSNR